MEKIILIAVISIAILYLILRTLRRAKGKPDPLCDCGSKDKCSGCSVRDKEPTSTSDV